MGWADEMAAQFRQRDNKAEIRPQIGEVISHSPLRIALLADAVILEPSQLYVCSALAEGQKRTAQIEIAPAHAALQTIDENGSVTGQGSITFTQPLKSGDLVACIPTAVTPGKAQKFIVIDRVVQ